MTIFHMLRAFFQLLLILMCLGLVTLLFWSPAIVIGVAVYKDSIGETHVCDHERVVAVNCASDVAWGTKCAYRTESGRTGTKVGSMMVEGQSVMIEGSCRWESK